ncbi:MAG: polysaccharide deacetylase family protein [Lachnospiraceae bacterium]|nr:polysaccharide deacetylase family protein [Lachnospiraceae bacterium]
MKSEYRMKKRIIRIAGIFSLFFTIALGIISYKNNNLNYISVMSSNNWGLSFQEEGKSPVIDVDKETLEQLDAYYLGDEENKKLYLTFDAGYENGNTEKILDALKENNVKATFFLVGNYLEKCPEIVKRMVEEGHTVGNHTYHHKDMNTLTTKEAFIEELTSLEDLYQNIVGSEMPKFYRPPQGKFSEEQLMWAKEEGYKTCFWSLAYVDWDEKKQPSKDEAIEKLTSRIHPGAIILLHSTSSTNGEIMGDIIHKWKEMGYEFGELSEL